MFLRTITISNFRRIEHAELTDLDNTVVLYGRNGSGKSSVLLAIQMLLFGWCKLTSRSGAGVERLIRDGNAEAEISAQIEHDEHNLVVTMTIKSKGTANEWTCLDAATGEILCHTREQMWQLLGIREEHATIASMPDLFMEDPKAYTEMGAILTELIMPTAIKRNDVLALAEDHADWLVQFTGKRGLKLDSFSALECVGATAATYRTDVNRNIKEQTIRLKEYGFFPDVKDAKGNMLTVEDIPRIQSGIEKLRIRHNALLVEKGAAGSAYTPADIQKFRTALADNEKSLTLLRERHESVHAAEQSARAERDTVQAELSSLRMQGGVLSSQMRQATEAAEKVGAPTGFCAKCTKIFEETMRVPLRKEVEKAEKTLAEHRDREGAALEALPALHDAAAETGKKLQQAENELRGASDAVARCEAELANAMQHESARPLADVNTELAEVSAKIERGEGIVSSLTRIGEKTAMEGSVAQGQVEVEHLNWAVAAFRDGALLKQLIGSGCDEFVRRCNRELEPFDRTLDLAIEGKNLQVLLGGRPVHLCSDGEQMIAQIAIAGAFADCGAPILLDEINVLDQDNRGGLGALSCTARLGTFMVAGASITSGLDGPVDGVTVLQAESGKVIDFPQGPVPAEKHS